MKISSNPEVEDFHLNIPAVVVYNHEMHLLSVTIWRRYKKVIRMKLVVDKRIMCQSLWSWMLLSIQDKLGRYIKVSRMRLVRSVFSIYFLMDKRNRK